MRAAVAAEAAGVPSVSIVCRGFEGQAAATARGLGYDGLSLATLRSHVDGESYDDMVAAFVTHTIPEICAGLCTPVAHEARSDGPPPASRPAEPTGPAEATAPTASPPPASRPAEVEGAWDVAARGTIDEVHARFVERGWTDGLPFIPPTRERVEAFITDAGFDPFRTLGVARPSGRDVTIWALAVNGVMAGCRPEQLPVLVAIATILLDPRYGAEHSGNTTGADALVVLSGPDTERLHFNSAAGALRDGTPANTSVGRWVRLVLRNIFGFTADEHDKATFGNTFRVVLAEDQRTLEDLGWPSLGADLGGCDSSAASVVSMARINSSIMVGSVFGSTPEEIVPYLADGLVRATGWDLTHVFGLGRGHYRPLLVLSPMLARVFHRAGRSKDEVRADLFAHARIPAWKYEKLIGEWTNLTAGRRRLVDLAGAGEVPAVYGESDDPNRLVPIVDAPGRFCLAVAGDPNRANAMAFANDGPHGYWTTAPVDHTPATDLLCRVDGENCTT